MHLSKVTSLFNLSHISLCQKGQCNRLVFVFGVFCSFDSTIILLCHV